MAATAKGLDALPASTACCAGTRRTCCRSPGWPPRSACPAAARRPSPPAATSTAPARGSPRPACRSPVGAGRRVERGAGRGRARSATRSCSSRGRSRASLGVVRVDDPGELAAQFAFAHDTTVPGAPSYDVSVLVEQYADGPEISVDAVVHRGTVFPMVLARKQLGYPPYFEEVGHVVDGADPLLADDRLRRVLQDTHAALGFADGVTHTELRADRGRADGDRGQRPARRRPHPVPRHARHRRSTRAWPRPPWPAGRRPRWRGTGPGWPACATSTPTPTTP